MSEDTKRVGFWREDNTVIQYNVEHCQNERHLKRNVGNQQKETASVIQWNSARIKLAC